MLKLGVLVSGSGTNLQSILDAERRGDLGGARVLTVVSNKPGVKALDRAKAAGIETVVVNHKQFGSREAFEDALLNVLAPHEIDLVVLAGFMRMLTERFLHEYADRVINIHPALLPSFPGVDAQKQAFEHGVKLTGVTVHFVDEGTDTGPIIAQEPVVVRDDDTVDTLRARILEEEHRIYPRVIRAIAEGRVRREGRRVFVNE
jgi:phosphoribosylglycinamide formyltransferase-1